MPKFLLTALAAATLFANFCNQAGAITPAAFVALNAGTDQIARFTLVGVVCGMNGCAPVHITRVQRPLRPANAFVPLVVPTVNTPRGVILKK